MPRKKSPKQHHTSEFQQQAVQLARSSGKPASAIASELGVPVWRLQTWLREATGKEERVEGVDELLKLQNENKRLKEENEFLKKASAYFAKLQR